MTFYPANTESLVAFIILLASMFGFIIYAIVKTKYRVKAFINIYVVYLLVFSAIVASGLARENPDLWTPILFATAMLAAAGFARSTHGSKIATTLPFALLLGIHSLRFPLELLLHEWAGQNTIPPTMTWTGQNFDVISGIVAIAAIPFVNRHRNVAWAVNIIGFVLLLNVLRVVLMSSPLPFAWPLENPLQLILYFPYALIVPVIVAPVLALHLITFRKLIPRLNSSALSKK